MKIEDFVGHRVRITFHKAGEQEGSTFKVKKVEAELTSYVAGTAFSLSDITAAFDEDGNNITEQAKMLHGAMIGHPFNIFLIESPKPVV
jgi:hypothetical protein